jgi:hypothetical protein
MYEYICIIPLFRNEVLIINVGDIITNLMFNSGTYYAVFKDSNKKIELSPSEFDEFFVKKSNSSLVYNEQKKWIDKILKLAIQ